MEVAIDVATRHRCETHGGVVAAANGSRAALIARRGDLRLVALSDKSAGGAWSALVPIGSANCSDLRSNNYEITFATDAAGNATCTDVDPATCTLESTGNLKTNRWSQPVPISAPHRVAYEQPFFRTYALGTAPDGFAVIAE